LPRDVDQKDRLLGLTAIAVAEVRGGLKNFLNRIYDTAQSENKLHRSVN
jgi:hypothetical protein